MVRKMVSKWAPGLRIRKRTSPGSPPGTLAADPQAPRPSISVIAYGPEGLDERRIESIGDIAPFLGQYPVVWVNIDGLGDAEVIRAAARLFGFHPLAQEDVLNVHQRAKVEEYTDHVFIVSRMATFIDRLSTEQISLFLGRGFVVTFQERKGDCLDPIRDRIRTARGRIRTSGADYLAYAILDAIIDNYFPVLERCGETLEEMEARVLEHPDRSLITSIHEARRDLLTLRRAIWPQRDAINSLLRDLPQLISSDTQLYLRDASDHCVQIIDLVENYREIASGLIDVYMSSASHRLNEIMQVLTVFAAIFIPLTFIAGVYGMNFDPERSPLNMPELEWYFGYPFALLLMAAVAGWLVYLFYRKGWIGRNAGFLPRGTPRDDESNGNPR